MAEVAPTRKPSIVPAPPVLADFRSWLLEGGVTDATATDYTGVLRRFTSWSEGTNGKAFAPGELDRVDVEDYLARLAREGEPATHNKALTILRVFVRFGTAQGYLTGDPTRRVRRIAVPQAPARALSPDQRRAVRKLLIGQAAKKLTLTQRALLALGYYGGLRASEAARLAWSDLDRRGGAWRLNILGKRQRRRTIHVHQTAREVLERLEEHQQKRGIQTGHVFPTQRRPHGTPKWFHDQMQVMCAQHPALHGVDAGGEEWSVTYHQLRHDVGTRMLEVLQRKGDLRAQHKVALFLGHLHEDGSPNLQQVARYIQPTQEELDAAAAETDLWD